MIVNAPSRNNAANQMSRLEWYLWGLSFALFLFNWAFTVTYYQSLSSWLLD